MNKDNFNILIVEDNHTNQIYVNKLVTELGYSTVLLENGKLAVDYLKQNSDIIDLILMDIEMPVLNGIAATEQIRQLYPELPIVAITVHVPTDFPTILQIAGFNQIITKPFNKDRIQGVLEKYLKR